MTDTQVAFIQTSYRVVVDGLDRILQFMMDDHGMTEDQAQAWMKDFVVGHYFPVWREMNRSRAEFTRDT